MELHQKLESKWKQPAGMMKKATATLLRMGLSEKEIHDIAQGCALYCLANEVNFIVAFNLYASIEGAKKQTA